LASIAGEYRSNASITWPGILLILGLGEVIMAPATSHLIDYFGGRSR
jgi:hypothetical protein